MDKIWANELTDAAVIAFCSLFYVSFLLLLYRSWHETKSFALAIKRNRSEVLFFILPFIGLLKWSFSFLSH